MRLVFIQFILIMFAAQVGFIHASEEEAVYDTLESELAEKDQQRTKEKTDFKKAVKEFQSI